MSFKKTVGALVLSLVSVMSFSVNSTVIDYADISGLTTFQDTTTGRIWLDMDNFFDEASNNGTSGNDMIAIAQAAGFTFAVETDVRQLLDSLPLTSSEWSSYAAVMGYGIPRQLIWGMFDDGANPYAYAWAWSTSTSWSYAMNATDANNVQNNGSNGAVDMGIWAYRTTAVPEPGVLAIFTIGLMLFGIARRRA